MYQKHHIPYKATFFLFLVFLFAYTVSAEATEKYCQAFHNNSSQINFLTAKFLLKNEAANLNLMDLADFKGFDMTWNDQYVKGTLMHFYKKNRDRLPQKYEALSQRIEKKKINLRLGTSKDCDITKSNFKDQFEKFTAYVLTEAQKVYKGNDFQELEKLINNHKKNVYKDLDLVSEPKANTQESQQSIDVSESEVKKKSSMTDQNKQEQSKESEEEDEVTPKTNKTDIDSLETQINDLKKQIDTLQARMNHIRIIIYLAFGLGLILFLLGFVIIRKLSGQISELNGSHSNFLNKMYDNKESIDDLNNKLHAISKDIETVQNDLDRLDIKFNNIREEMGAGNVSNETPQGSQAIPVVPSEAPPPPPPPKVRYYLPFPDKAGFFWDAKKSKIARNDSLFVLELDNEFDSQGKVTIDPDPTSDKSVKSALNNPSTFLKPVCNIINENTAGNSIQVIEPGSVRKEKNGRWYINENKKIKIRIV
jgi:hypothetical protein